MSENGPTQVPITGELVTSPGRTLFATDDPVEVLDHARRLADALKTALDAGGMTLKIGRREHVLIDGWQTLGAMLGVSPYVVWSRPLGGAPEDVQHTGWEARAEARTVDGRVVGAAEAMVTRAEANWRDADDYAIRSMAQTRAMSKALRGPLGFVVTLAGRSATPAEEMGVDPDAGELPDWARPVDTGRRLTVHDNLAAIFEHVGVGGAGEPADLVAGRLLARTADDCGGEIPACIAKFAHRIAWGLGAGMESTDDTEGNDQ